MQTGRLKAIVVWAAIAGVVIAPLVAAAASPLLAWRDPIYIMAGFAGVASMILLFIQPLAIAGWLPGLGGYRGRIVHRAIGTALVLAVLIHVSTLWMTSPPDVVDALLFRSPTPFSAWGVIAMWAVFAAALLAVFRRRLRLRPRSWRRLHTSLAAAVVLGSVIHALLIEGTMETMTKAALCILVPGATIAALIDLRIWGLRLFNR
ncbi:MAG: ferric reductase-like transmembrane domain-containing protein [Pseudomonadota bacterium]